MEVKHNVNSRGFDNVDFVDRYQKACSIQKSSLATEECIWFGINDPDPQIMCRDAKKLGVDTDKETGWISYPIPNEVLLSTRMHLSRDQVRMLIPILQNFVDTGEVNLED